MCNKRVVIQGIDKVGEHGENFALHNNKSTDIVWLEKPLWLVSGVWEQKINGGLGKEHREI